LNKNDFLTALQKMRDSSKQRKFVQSIELMINFKGLDFKKSENQLDLKVAMPFATGRSRGKVLVFAKSKNFADEIKGKADKIIMESDIQGLTKKDVSQIIEEFDVLLAEGQVMLTVGKFLGQQLAPKNKMPKPIQPNVSQLESALAEMSSVTKVTNKKGKAMPVIQVVIGSEKMQNEQLSANAFAVFDAVLNAVPGKTQSIKSVFLKETMGPAIKVGEKE
jgi:large subunit ribosomal protein L1